MIHDLFPEFNSACKSCIIGLPELYSEAVSGHFPIYLVLGVYGVVPVVVVVEVADVMTIYIGEKINRKMNRNCFRIHLPRAHST
jgi:hypothetical protein